MRHRKGRRKLGRSPSHRTAMLRNMVTSLFKHGRIQTTDAKAKEIRRLADRVVSLSKRVPASSLAGLGEVERKAAEAKRLHAIRQASYWVRDRDVLRQIFVECGDRYADRAGGYTRVLKVGYRDGDNAPMSLIELVDLPKVEDVAAA